MCQTGVTDTFWSVHIKCCFHQKKTKSKRPTTRIRPAERQHKGRDQSSTKNVTSKTPRLHNVAKQHKVSDRSVWIQRQTVYKLNQIKFDLEKQRAKNEEKKQTELKKTEKDDAMENYRKLSIDDVIKKHA